MCKHIFDAFGIKGNSNMCKCVITHLQNKHGNNMVRAMFIQMYLLYLEIVSKYWENAIYTSSLSFTMLALIIFRDANVLNSRTISA